MNKHLVAYLYAVIQQIYKDVLVVLEDKNLSPRSLYKLNRIRLDSHLAINQVKPHIDPEDELDQLESEENEHD